MLRLFKFFADNTKVEFSLTYFNHNKKKWISLQTYANMEWSNISPGYARIGLKLSQVMKEYHNHPANTPYSKEYTEKNSMGYSIWSDGSKHMTGDLLRTNINKITHPNFVYLPKSGNLWNVKQTSIEYIKKINKSFDLKL